MIVGKIVELDPKMGRGGGIWLLKFKFQPSDGSSPQWLGAYTDRAGAPKAFASRALEERDMPEASRTEWALEVEKVAEKGYTNLYVTSARAVSDGEAITPATTGPMAHAPAVPTAATSRDASIIRQVAFKGAIEVSRSTGEQQDMNDLALRVHVLTNAFNRILQQAPGDQYVPIEPEPVDEPPEVDDDPFADEVPL
jgi:hypothetical protein